MESKSRVTDQSIAQRVAQQLRSHGLQSGSHISIMVQEGAVMLSGDIDQEHHRHVAIQTARAIQGVRTVVDRLHLKK